jgi:hypothetical protein
MESNVATLPGEAQGRVLHIRQRRQASGEASGLPEELRHPEQPLKLSTWLTNFCLKHIFHTDLHKGRVSPKPHFTT